MSSSDHVLLRLWLMRKMEALTDAELEYWVNELKRQMLEKFLREREE